MHDMKEEPNIGDEKLDTFLICKGKSQEEARSSTGLNT